MSSLAPRQWLTAALAATLLFRFWLSVAVPVTADEAYFILWGRAPALGYYDHPPMIGWLLAPLAALSEAPWLLRLPAVLVPPLAALAVRAALLRWFARDEDTATRAALAVLLVPMNVWNVLVTTDTPLVLLSVASLLAFARAAQQGSNALFFVAGILLGLAFLSKYFAVLLGLGYLAWALLSRRPGAFGLVFLVFSKALKKGSVKRNKDNLKTSDNYYIHYNNLSDIIRLSKLNISEVNLADILHEYKKYFTFYNPERELIRLEFIDKTFKSDIIIDNLNDMVNYYKILFEEHRISSSCIRCGKEIKKNSNIQKYCKECGKIVRNEKQKELMRKRRSVSI